MDTLFRSEAYESIEVNSYGSTTVYQPISIQVMVGVTICITVLIFLFLFFGEYTKKETVVGYLEPTMGLISVWAPHQGVLNEVYIHEGQIVKKGDPMFVISSVRASLQSSDIEQIILQQLMDQKNNLEVAVVNERDMEAAEVLALESNYKELELQLQQVMGELGISIKKTDSQRVILNRYRKLQKNNFLSILEVEQAVHKLLDYQSQSEAIKNRKINIQNEMSRIGDRVRLRALNGKKEQNKIQQKILVIDRQITDQQQKQASVVLAPSDGIVSTLPIYKNQMIVNRQRLTVLLPMDAKLKATLAVPSKSSGFLDINQPVNIRYSAFPYQKFGYQVGAINEIDQSLTVPSDPQFPIKVVDPVYLVSVSLQDQSVFAYDKSYSLKAGMTLEADIDLERRKIIEWLLEPVIGFAK